MNYQRRDLRESPKKKNNALKYLHIADGNANYRLNFSCVDTIFFRLTLAHKFYIDTSNVAKISLETLFVRKGPSDNNLSLNVEKTKEIVVDFRRVHTQHAPLTINGATMERVSSTKFLGVHITEDLSWTNNTAALAKKAQQRLYFLRNLRRARATAPIMCTFYRGTIESILTSCITVWYGACNASCRKSLQRIVRAAEKIVGVSLPSLQDLYSTRLTRKALSIAGDPTHPTHSFFSLLPSGRRLRSLQARTNRLKDSFIHQAVRKLNSLPSLPPLPSLTPRTTELKTLMLITLL